MKNIILLIIILFVALPSYARIDIGYEYNEDVYFSGVFLKAYNIAYKEFKKEGYDLGKYKVLFKRTANNEIQISFIPIPKDIVELERSTGGGNSSGQGMSYIVSLIDFHIIEEWGSR